MEADQNLVRRSVVVGFVPGQHLLQQPERRRGAQQHLQIERIGGDRAHPGRGRPEQVVDAGRVERRQGGLEMILFDQRAHAPGGAIRGR